MLSLTSKIPVNKALLRELKDHGKNSDGQPWTNGLIEEAMAKNDWRDKTKRTGYGEDAISNHLRPTVSSNRISLVTVFLYAHIFDVRLKNLVLDDNEREITAKDLAQKACAICARSIARENKNIQKYSNTGILEKQTRGSGSQQTYSDSTLATLSGVESPINLETTPYRENKLFVHVGILTTSYELSPEKMERFKFLLREEGADFELGRHNLYEMLPQIPESGTTRSNGEWEDAMFYAKRYLTNDDLEMPTVVPFQFLMALACICDTPLSTLVKSGSSARKDLRHWETETNCRH